MDAIRHLETAVLAADGIDSVALRYGGFYGPGTTMGAGGERIEAVRKRQFPIVGDGGGVLSFIHVEDAASAAVAALHGPPGVCNIVDDGPAPARDVVMYIATLVEAKLPRRVPKWLARMLAGENAVVLMTEARGSSNANSGPGSGSVCSGRPQASTRAASGGASHPPEPDATLATADSPPRRLCSQSWRPTRRPFALAANAIGDRSAIW
jgi:NAD dependent epimerase/dehydratase family